MDNPMQRKNRTAADAGAERAQPMPAGPSAPEQGRHRTDEAPAETGQAADPTGSATRPAGPPADEAAAQRPPAAQKSGAATAPDGSKAASPPGSAPASGGPEATGTVPTQSAGGPAGSRPAARGAGGAATADTSDQGVTLFSDDDQRRFQGKWRDAQGDFVDDPKQAVETADELVDEVLRTLTEKFAAHKRTLEEQWSRQGEADTESLRKAMRGYRTFFQQLLQTRD